MSCNQNAYKTKELEYLGKIWQFGKLGIASSKADSAENSLTCSFSLMRGNCLWQFEPDGAAVLKINPDSYRETDRSRTGPHGAAYGPANAHGLKYH